MILYYVILLFSAVPKHPWFGSDVGGITLIKITGAICLVYAIFRLTTRKSAPPLFSSWPARLFIVIFLMALTSYIFTNRGAGPATPAVIGYLSGIASSPLSIYFSIGVLFFITLTVIDSPWRLRASLYSIMGGIGIASLYTVREWQAGGFSSYRPGWVAGDANYYAATSLLTLPLSYYLAREKGSRFARIFCWGCLGITVIGFVSASSRGGLVGLALAAIYVFIRAQRRLGLIMLIGLLVVAMLFAPISPIQRFLHPSRGDNQSVQTHEALWAAGLQMVWQNPFFGIGFGNFKPTIAELGVLGDSSAIAHNAYLEYAAELGIPALLIFLGVLLSTFLLLEKVRRHAAESFFRQAALGLQAGVIGFAGSAFFISAEYVKPFWLVVFISCSMPPLILAEKVANKTPREVREPQWEPGLGFGTAQKGGEVWIGERSR